MKDQKPFPTWLGWTVIASMVVSGILSSLYVHSQHAFNLVFGSVAITVGMLGLLANRTAAAFMVWYNRGLSRLSPRGWLFPQPRWLFCYRFWRIALVIIAAVFIPVGILLIVHS